MFCGSITLLSSKNYNTDMAMPVAWQKRPNMDFEGKLCGKYC